MQMATNRKQENPIKTPGSESNEENLKNLSGSTTQHLIYIE